MLCKAGEQVTVQMVKEIPVSCSEAQCPVISVSNGQTYIEDKVI